MDAEIKVQINIMSKWAYQKEFHQSYMALDFRLRYCKLNYLIHVLHLSFTDCCLNGRKLSKNGRVYKAKRRRDMRQTISKEKKNGNNSLTCKTSISDSIMLNILKRDCFFKNKFSFLCELSHDYSCYQSHKIVP